MKCTFSNSSVSPLATEGHDHPSEQVHETEDLIRTSLVDLEKQLEKIPAKKKQAWTQAQRKCQPNLIDNKFKLMFLRRYRFDAKLAAERLVRYWEQRIEKFGKEKAFLPLTFSGALKGEVGVKTAIETGYLRLLPGVHDPMGRAVIHSDQSRNDLTRYTRSGMMRAFWYLMHAAMEEESVQRNGIVLLATPRNSRMGQFDRTVSNKNVHSFRHALPVATAIIHVCHPPAFLSILMPIAKTFLGNLLHNIHVHSGTDEDVQNSLASFGLSHQTLPTDVGGDVVLDQKKWLEERMSLGL